MTAPSSPIDLAARLDELAGRVAQLEARPPAIVAPARWASNDYSVVFDDAAGEFRFETPARQAVVRALWLLWMQKPGVAMVSWDLARAVTSGDRDFRLDRVFHVRAGATAARAWHPAIGPLLQRSTDGTLWRLRPVEWPEGGPEVARDSSIFPLRPVLRSRA